MEAVPTREPGDLPVVRTPSAPAPAPPGWLPLSGQKEIAPTTFTCVRSGRSDGQLRPPFSRRTVWLAPSADQRRSVASQSFQVEMGKG